MIMEPKQLAGLLLEGREDGVIEQFKEIENKYSRLSLYEDFITPAMYYIGELWEENEITVADEHLATAVCDFALSRTMEQKYRQADEDLPVKKKAMLFSVEGEQHYIGMKMAAALFRDKGWSVRYHGPDLPLDHALAAIKQWKPDVVSLSAALSYRLPAVKEYIAKISNGEYKPLILVGGRMAKKYGLSSFQKDDVIIIRDLRSLQYWLDDCKGGRNNANSS
ncbi:cobalamin-dependent protein [Evansella sp. LMS18]|jgi:methanogenic corrinoid protein MtbC1|uniref:cobalamin B12-binding domain-containing protein n=1 Tax=Evansella sp. LMS18 TaxID=2924033 RepID=UPI0020D0CCB9|nr:cobalamin-dependent protein [Evansella sp. LMS18]UTR11484.1 cobalamin-dependent protein [Evansella sp. LMS18]